jgi:hypothetical protein
VMARGGMHHGAEHRPPASERPTSQTAQAEAPPSAVSEG